MKKILLFWGMDYEERGGWDDFLGSFDTVEEAKNFLNDTKKNPSSEWAHIVESGKMIFYGQDKDRNGLTEWEWEKCD